MFDMTTKYIEVLGHRVRVEIFENYLNNPTTWNEAVARIESVIKDGCFDDDCKLFRWTVISNIQDKETIQSFVSFALSKTIDSYRQTLIDNDQTEAVEQFESFMDSFGQFADDWMRCDLENWYENESYRKLISPLINEQGDS